MTLPDDPFGAWVVVPPGGPAGTGLLAFGPKSVANFIVPASIRRRL
jgi:hypothetical protein